MNRNTRDTNPNNIIDEVCEGYLRTSPYIATREYSTHTTEVAMPFTPIDPRGVLSRELKRMTKSATTSADLLLYMTLEDIVRLDRKWCQKMYRLPLYHGLQVNPISQIVDLINGGYQPLNSHADLEHCQLRLRRGMDLIRYLTRVMNDAASDQIVCSKVYISRLIGGLTKDCRLSSDITRRFPELEKQMNESVLPFLRKWGEWLREHYLPRCSDHLGLYQLPGSISMYTACIEYHTGHSFHPEEIYELGEEVVKSLQGRQQALIQEQYPGMSLLEYVSKVQMSSENRFRSAEHMVQYANELLDRFDVQLRQQFELPQGYERPQVLVLHDPTKVLGWAEIGSNKKAKSMFHLNTAEWRTTVKSDLVPLILHEAIPGHSFQLQFDDVPECLKSIHFFNNVMEGIGLYAEECFETNNGILAEYSRLNYHMWRALRLVVDSGIHYKGWGLEESLRYMRSYCYLDENMLKTEIIRYSSYPGQACAYYIGYLDLKRIEQKWRKKYPNKSRYAFINEVLKIGKYSMNAIEKALE